MTESALGSGDLFYKGPDVEILSAPEVDNRYESSARGIHIIGDLSGIPLLKNAVNMGQDFVEKIGPSLRESELEEGEVHLLIVGGGGAGLAAALAAKEMGLRYLLVEQKHPGNTINSFFKGKEIFAEPEALPNRSRLWVKHSYKEELLEHWKDMIEKENLNLVDCERVTDIRRDGASLVVETTKEEYRARRVALAMGRSGNPRMLKIPGEELPKVHHVLVDPDEHTMEKIAVVGGGDASVEAALALAAHNEVTLIVRTRAVRRAQKANIEGLNQRVEAGKITLLTEAKALEVREHSLDVEIKGESQTIANDRLFVMIGSDPPDEFLKGLKIKNVGDWSLKKTLFFVGVAALVFLLYGWKKQAFWPFVPGGPLYAWTSWQPSMWFGLLYSTLITGFGIKAILRYRRDPYQVKRYLSLILSQVLLFWVIPEFIFQMMWPVQGGWRAYGLFFPAPLYVWNFWAPQDAHIFWFAWSIVISIAGVPLLAKVTGKKYCAFVCSCGGLAETLGDSFRTLSPRGRRMRAWENLLTYTVTVLVAMVIAFGLADKDSGWWTFQGNVIDFLLAGVVGLAAYPFWGNRIWCRFLCPLAKLLYIFAKDNSRVKITSGQHCIRCTLCSKYCQMGIPVMEFAKNGAAFSPTTTSGLQCGSCLTVCPVRNLPPGDWSEEHWKEEIEQGPPVHVV